MILLPVALLLLFSHFSLSMVIPTHQCHRQSPSDTDLFNFQKNNNEFAIKLYNLAREEAGEGNVFFSPTSISLALGMVLAGANGNTKAQIKEHLAKDLSDNEILKSYVWLMNELNGQKTNYTLYTANGMYVQEEMRLEDEFSQIVTQCFNSSAQLRDFRTQYEVIRNEVNEWVEEMTNDKIKDLIPKNAVNSLTRMILVNAIYFKGEWLHPFTNGSARTYKRPFYPLSNPESPKRVDFMKMHHSRKFPYYENDELQVLELQYQQHELSMFILLPRQRSGLPNLEAILTEQRLSELIAHVQPRLVHVNIPKWKLTQNLPLKKILEEIGMTNMFDSSADFSGMTGKRDLFISDAIHKAFIEVNEKGTEAAAATAFIMEFKTTSLRPETEIPSFVADHPFLFIIQHKSTKNYLFIGSLTDFE